MNSQKLSRRSFIVKTAVASGSLALSEGLLSQNVWAANGTIKVGVLIPLSGPAGLFGPSSQNCANLAIDEINKAGGLLGNMIEPVFADVGGAPADAKQAALKLWKGEKVKAFIGMHDSAVRGALTNLFKGQIPYIYTPVYEGGECSKGVYVIGETPAQQLQPVIPYLSSQKDVNRWYLIGNDYNWPRDTNAIAKKYINEAGGKIVGEEYLPFTADNFDSNLAKIKQSGANGVLITLVGGASVGFNRAFANFGLSSQAIRLGTLIEENTLMGIGAENSKNLFASAGYFANIDTGSAKSFAQKYYQKFGQDAAILNALGESCYEGVILLQALVKKAESFSVGQIEKMAQGVSYTGPRGQATLEARHFAKDIYLAEAQGTTFNVLKTFSDVDSGQTCT